MDQSKQDTQQIRATCCVVGGGPAGMMLGLLLARAGVEVIVLEKHADFFRDFRGDTIHPSTLELMYELGMLDEFLRLPHQELRRVKVRFDDEEIAGPDFSHLPTRCKFIAMMPQWDFLNFLTTQAKRYPTFHLLMKVEAADLIEEGGRVVGVRAKTEQGDLDVRADLVVGADGRDSIVRERAGMEVEDQGVPIDVLWFQIAKSADDSEPALGRIRNGKMMVTIDRGGYYQCGYIIRKGAFEEIKGRGLEAFREGIVSVAPFLRDTAPEIDDWDKVKLLTVQVNRLRQWYRPGLLCIGDAAHAMSPAGGVGINLAIQDAVAAANLLAVKLRRGNCETDDLRLVQQRREWPARMTQAIQVFIHRRMFGPKADPRGPLSFPWPVRMLLWLVAPLLRRVAARVIGIGFRAEHITNNHLARSFLAAGAALLCVLFLQAGEFFSQPLDFGFGLLGAGFGFLTRGDLFFFGEREFARLRIAEAQRLARVNHRPEGHRGNGGSRRSEGQSSIEHAIRFRPSVLRPILDSQSL